MVNDRPKDQMIGPAGVASAEAFGTPSVSQTIHAQSVPSGEQVFSPAILLKMPAGRLLCLTTHSLLVRARSLSNDLAQGSVLERRSLVLACVMQSCAWIEGFANDVYEGCVQGADDPTWLPSVRDRELVRQVGLAWRAGKAPRGISGSLKWEKLLKRLGLKLAGPNACPQVEAMIALVALRNAFVHAEPMLHPTANEAHLKLESMLQGRFALDAGNGFLWPTVLSIGCAEWALATARTFGLHVAGMLGMPDPFQLVLERFELV